ncbi:MAG: DUF4157 domain-containing protein [Acidobacteriota bacterium]|nr:DUF4157 domain-containing protein [Acidobacteriota bacterium]
MPLSLPPMPDIVSKQFDRSLVSWQPPERFIGEMGHLITDSAPTGIVEGLVVVTPGPPVEPAPAWDGSPAQSANLPLATPPVADQDRPRRRDRFTTRRIEWADPRAEVAAGPELAPPHAETAAESPTPAVHVDPEAVPAPGPEARAESPSGTSDQVGATDFRPEPSEESAELIGRQPLVAPSQPITVPLAPEPEVGRFMRAPVPADMPLASLPSSPLPRSEVRTLVPPPGFGPPPVQDPADQADEPASPVTGAPSASAETTPPATNPAAAPPPGESAAPPASGLVPGPGSPATTGLVGDRPLAGTDPTPLTPATPLTGSDLGEPGAPGGPGASGDLPLATASGPARSGAGGTQIRRLDGPPNASESPGEAARPAPVEPGPTAAESGPASDLPPAPAGDSPTGGPVASVEPVAGPAAPPAGPGVVAPLLGQVAPPAGPGEVRAGSAPEAGPDSTAQTAPLVLPSPGATRRGLGEPMEHLPSTATPWDITRMSRDQQLQMSRDLLQGRIAAASRNQLPGTLGFPLGMPSPPGAEPSPGPAPMAAVAVGRAFPEQPVYAGSELPLARLEPLGRPPVGVIPADLPDDGGYQAPLLGAEPRTFPEGGTEEGSTEEGQQARQVVGQRFGVDLSNVPIDRSPRGAMEVARLRARAITSDRAVVIPAAVGSLDVGPGRALLTHELTHVAQRARFGSSLPAEDSPAGQVLEAQALQAEMTLNTGPVIRTTMEPPQGGPRPTTWTGVLNSSPEAGSAGAPLPLAGPGSPSLDADALANTILERLSEITSEGPVTQQFQAPAMAPIMAAPAPVPVGAVQRAADDLPAQAVVQEPPAPQTGVADGDLERPSDEDLSNLSRWLYPWIRYRLRGELREDRERAGLLTDHYRRW